VGSFLNYSQGVETPKVTYLELPNGERSLDRLNAAFDILFQEVASEINARWIPRTVKDEL